MSTDENQPDIGFFLDAMSGPLAAASALYPSDARFHSIATLVETISTEWTGDNAQTDSDLDSLGQSLLDVQQSHPTDSNVHSAVQSYLALQGVRSGPWRTPVKPPLAPAAALPTAKLTVFDVSGTSALSVLTGGAAGTTAQSPPSWNLAGLIDPNLITIKEVPYPAGMPFNNSYQKGVTNLEAMITNTPGPFALVGTSQGAMVIAAVYDAVRKGTGALASRTGDLRQGIAYGNPCRKRGSIAPGCADPGGYGINVDSWLQSVVDPNWWDFVNPGDPAACNGAGPWNVDGVPYDYRSGIGQWAATLFAEMCTTFSGNPATLIAGLNVPLNIVPLATALFGTLIGATVGPHTTYDKTKPKSGSPLTCTQLAANQLMDIAGSL
jgi:hypothetical protein